LRCRERIDKESVGADRLDLLTVSQVMAQLKFPQLELPGLLGGREVMIESPLIQELRAEPLREAVLNLLKARFTKVPRDVRRLVNELKDEGKLQGLIVLASQADNMEAFKEHLLR
jgi:hypothetical protein